MDIVRLAVNRPVGVAVGGLLIVMFGLIGVRTIPIQLTPTIDRPIINISTSWPGRSPQEIVDEITKEQEERVKNVSNLRAMRSLSSEGMSAITLEFYIGTDMARALQEVSDALRQVPNYPDEVDEPVIRATEGATENAIAWIILDLPPEARARHPDFDITTLHDALMKEVKPFLERIDGVAQINIYGGREREVRVLVDLPALAQRSLGPLDVIQALRAENTNVSAGSISEGKRDYRVRVVGQFHTADDVLDTIIAYRDGKPVYVRDVADVRIGHERQRVFVRAFGAPCIAMNALRQSGANVVDVMDQLRARLEDVRRDILPNLAGEVGKELRLRQVYDETVYIDSAINLVTSNLAIGGTAAAIVLLLFLRSLVSTGIIALAIPISIIGTFLALVALGRTLNVISLAGLAFAVGMVVDNAIVVLENIHRRVQLGQPRLTAAYRGAREVWGAILASTLTTAAVFIPVLTIQEEAGQLFRDISLAVVASVLLSLFVSITVIPAAAARWMTERDGRPPGRVRTAWESLFGLAPLCASLTRRVADAVHWAITGWRGWSVRPAGIVLMTGLSIGGAILLMPPLDYLPPGNRNLVFGGLSIPPGTSIEQMRQHAERIEAAILPYAEADINDPASVARLAPIRSPWVPGLEYDAVPVRQFFIGAFGGTMFAGATSQNEEVVLPIGVLLSSVMASVPDAQGGAAQASIFGRGGAGNSIDVEISGPSVDRVRIAAERVYHAAGQKYGFGPSVRSEPGNFTLRQQESQVRITRRGRDLGLTTRDLGIAVRGLFDGAFVSDFKLGGDTVDLVVLPNDGRLEYKEMLLQIPVATPAGPVVPLDEVVEVTPSLAPQAIQRIEELAAVTIKITPPVGQPLDEAMADIRRDLIEPARQAGLIDQSMRVRMEGTAAKLDEVRASLFGRAGSAPTGVRRAAEVASVALLVAGIAVLALALHRFARSRRATLLYGGVGAVLLAMVLGGLLLAMGEAPHLLTARFVWALAVTYLLMCALFESFTYPLVIMFSVPLAIVGGFAGLAVVHAWTMMDKTKPPQLFDVLTMLGFVILIGVVVNNAILIVHQALNFMRGDAEEGEEGGALPPMRAIAESVRTRMRPIFMSTTTSIAGMLALVLMPGAGSEMYRGLGAVVVGGLLVSTVFTLVLVPLTFSLVVDIGAGLRALRGAGDSGAPRATLPPPRESRQLQSV